MDPAPPFTTARLVLRDFVPEDEEPVRAYRRDPRYLAQYPPNDDPMTEAAHFVVRCRSWAAERPRRKFQLALALRPDGPLVGNAGLRLLEPGGGEIGYELDPRFWGRGLAGEAVDALLRFGFGALGLRRVEATTGTGNLRSVRLLRRRGFARERAPAAGPDQRGVYALESGRWRAGEIK